jgi:hypothetical protein
MSLSLRDSASILQYNFFVNSLDEATPTCWGTEFPCGTDFHEHGDIIRRGAAPRMQQWYCQLIFVGDCRDNRIKIAKQDTNCRDVTVTVALGQRINFTIQQFS